MHTASLRLLLAALLAACSGGGSSPPAAAAQDGQQPALAAAPTSVSPQARAEAEQIFAGRCFACHGAKGAGDGPASKGFSPPPRDLTAPEWQAGVTDDYLEKIVKFGGAAVGKSPAMPPNPDLMSKPEVVAALRQHIRELKK